jgi:hypothetical protein
MRQRPTARTVRRSHEFEEQAAQIEPDVRRFDEVMAGVEWGLAADPYQFPLVTGTLLRVVTTEAFPETPALRIFFTISDDEETISLLAVEWIEDIDFW